MDSDLSHPIALITGASRRIGKAMTEHLASGGWNIAVHYNRSEKEAAKLTKSLLRQYPGQNFGIFQADLSGDEEVTHLIPQVISQMGKPLLLINNASVFEAGNIAHTSAGFLDNTFRVNFRTPFLLMRDFAHLCGSGHMVNLVDTRITTHRSGYAAYSLSKKILWELTKMAAVEFGPAIRVNAIAPGLTLPPEDKDLTYLEELAKKIPMKRPGGVDPVLKALDYILGNDYLTGQLLFCDGGENLV